MSHSHSETFPFEVELNGTVYVCWFFLTDNRLITVTAAGKRHTQALGASPPRALAMTIASELLQREFEHHKPAQVEASPPNRGWLDRMFDRFGTAEPICLHC
jgi:hypothetical protein